MRAVRDPSPWLWVPSLYYTQALPYVIVTGLSVILYKELGLGNAEMAWLTSWLYLPWVIKPVWSPLLEMVGRRRTWVVLAQGVTAVGLASLALVLPAPQAVQASLALLWLVAFASATHDIAADGLYLLALTPHRQAAFVGVRSLFFRASLISAQGGLVMLAGWLGGAFGDPVRAWQVVMAIAGGGLALLAAWHALVLPWPSADVTQDGPRDGMRLFVDVLRRFFQLPGLRPFVAYLLLYRVAEALLLKLVAPFLLDRREAGGLGLDTQAVGLVYGSFGVAALIVGGLLGGWLIARHGLDRCRWPCALALNLPNAVYVALAATQPAALGWISLAVVVEQFGYGVGFAAYLVAMLMFVSRDDNPHRTAHYAICTGFMALGMMLPGMGAGWLQERLGYTAFFSVVWVLSLASLWVAARLPIDAGYGRADAETR